MRTLAIAVMLALLAVTCAVAEEEPQAVTYEVGITPETLDGLTGSVEELAGILEGYVEGPLAVYYEAAVKRTVVNAWVGMVIGIIIIAVGVVGFIVSEVNDGTGLALFFIAAGFIVIGIFVSRAYAPEYYAIRDIISSLR